MRKNVKNRKSGRDNYQSAVHTKVNVRKPAEAVGGRQSSRKKQAEEAVGKITKIIKELPKWIDSKLEKGLREESLVLVYPPKTYKSDFWEHFQIIEVAEPVDGNPHTGKAQCNKCNMFITIGNRCETVENESFSLITNGTSSLKNHLGRCRNNEDAKQLKLFAFNSASRVAKLRKMRREISKGIKRWLVKDIRPFAAANGEGFKDLLQMLIKVLGEHRERNVKAHELLYHRTTYSKQIREEGKRV